MGEICVTLPWNARSLNVSTVMRAGWPRRRLPISVSSTRPRTNTWEMSPIVTTGVAADPMLRIDDTGLPISTSRARMRAADGRPNRRVRQLLLRALDRCLRLRNVRRGFGHPRLGNRQLRLRRTTAVLGLLERRARFVERVLRDQLARRTGFSPARASGAQTRPQALPPRRGSSRTGPRRPDARRVAPKRVARTSRTRAIRFSRSSSTRTVPASTC